MDFPNQFRVFLARTSLENPSRRPPRLPRAFQSNLNANPKFPRFCFRRRWPPRPLQPPASPEKLPESTLVHLQPFATHNLVWVDSIPPESPARLGLRAVNLRTRGLVLAVTASFAALHAVLHADDAISISSDAVPQLTPFPSSSAVTPSLGFSLSSNTSHGRTSRHTVPSLSLSQPSVGSSARSAAAPSPCSPSAQAALQLTTAATNE